MIMTLDDVRELREIWARVEAQWEREIGEVAEGDPRYRSYIFDVKGMKDSCANMERLLGRGLRSGMAFDAYANLVRVMRKGAEEVRGMIESAGGDTGEVDAAMKHIR